MNFHFIEDIENAVIGAIMVEKTAIGRVSITPEYVFNPENKEILEAIFKLYSENKPLDIITINEATKQKHMKRLMEMTSKVSSAANIEYHCALIFQEWVRREFIYQCQKSQLKMAEEGCDPFKTIQEFNTSLEAFTIKTGKELKPFGKIATDTIKKIEKIQASGKSITGINTGFKDMNAISYGFHAPDLIIIAARPATGKTAFALNLAHNVASEGVPVAFFSLEMSSEQLATRLISSMSGVYSNYLTKGNIDEYGWKKIMDADYGIPIFVDDTPSLNIMDFKSKARAAKKKLGIGLIVVDYLQLMTVYTKGNREQEISTISRTLKAMAKELEVPIIALAQLGRDVEKSNREPRLSDLRESGAIEQDADIVMVLHNESSEVDDENPIIKVIWLKHRNGSVGFIQLKFEKGKLKFHDL